MASSPMIDYSITSDRMHSPSPSKRNASHNLGASDVNTDAASMLDVDGPPSSPFLSEVNDSRIPSGYFKAADVSAIVEENENLLDIQESSEKPSFKIDTVALHEDKENMPDQEPTLRRLFASPKKQSTPEPLSPRKAAIPEKPVVSDERRGSASSVAMPPPSTRKLHSTPRKTPLKASRSAANTPGPLSRGNSFEEATPHQQVSAFQAGLDQRTAAMPPQDQTNIDDTCFSDFSQVPEKTLFAKMNPQSPTKRLENLRTPGKENISRTPRTSRKRHSSSRSPSPTPRKMKTPPAEKDENTSFLIDFTQQFDSTSHSNRTSNSPAKSATQPNLLTYMNAQRSPGKPTPSSTRQSYSTPQKQSNIMNLLDFELPPAPTPRSIPTITVRELESLKSSYLSQISSLKANLSGREAEVESLKRAVADAERRAGEAAENLREERCRREHVEEEKLSWERRGQEVEAVLKNVKEEVMKGEGEKEEMARRIEEDERRLEEAEDRAVKAEERFADALAARGGDGSGEGGSATEEQVQRLVAAQIDSKIEAVSRELHSVYKEKHERKVATLKKSYEARSEKKMAELQARLSQLETENSDLAASNSNAMSPSKSSYDDSGLKAELESQRAVLARLSSELESSHAQQDQLVRELKQERIEKGDLVAAVDEMLAVQSDLQNQQQGQESVPGTPASQMKNAFSAVEDFRKSISRPPPAAPAAISGLRMPGESKIGRGGIPMPGARGQAGGVGKSRMLANIERMGRKGVE